MSSTFTLGLVQMGMSADAAANLARAESLIAEAARQGAQIICLPELFLSYYFCQTEDHAWFDLAEPIPGPTSLRLSELAKRHSVVIVGSIFEKRMPGLYHNSATVHDADGSLLGIYRKMHIPDDPLYLEKFYFTPGDLGWKTFATRHAHVGTLVCWDQWYPEAARLTALRGAELILYPTAIGWHPAEKTKFGAAQHDAWLTSMRGHAIANGIYVAAANRIGHEQLAGEGIEFWGQSFIADPFGRILAQASHNREEVLIARCDRQHLETVRRHWPFFRDRRVDAYEAITQRAIDQQARPSQS